MITCFKMGVRVGVSVCLKMCVMGVVKVSVCVFDVLSVCVCVRVRVCVGFGCLGVRGVCFSVQDSNYLSLIQLC